MPLRPLHQCNAPGCPRLARRRFCEACEARYLAKQRAETDADRGTASERGYGAAWGAKRARIFRRDANCRTCGAKGLRDDHVDHVVPKRVGGSDDDSNLQRLCKRCHNGKTATQDGGFGRPRTH